MNATIRDQRIRMSTANHERDFTTPPPAAAPVYAPHTNWSTPTMNQTNTAAWVTYTYASFGAAAGMTALGIWALPADLWVKG